MMLRNQSRLAFKLRSPRSCFLAVILLSTALLAGLSAGTAPVAAAASSSHLSSQQKALAEYRECKTLKVFHPPAGFKPLTATAAQLRAAGYPPRPPQSDPAALRTWTTAVNRPLHFSAPHPVCTGFKHSVIQKGNWAGHEVPESDYGDPIVQTGSAWVQPAVAGQSGVTSIGSAGDASFWTGTGLTDIIQAGCDSIATATPEYKCWTEDWPAGTDWQGPVVRPGQTIYVADEYIGSNQANYYFENESTGDVESYTDPAPNVGLGSADYMNEWIGPYLPDFGTVPVSSNTFELQNGTLYSLGENNIYQMENDGVIMSSPSFLSGSNFDQIWYSSTY
jgi:hypothetical protein